MTVGRICSRQVDTAEANESVRVAAQRMNDRNVGSLVVLDGCGAPIGIVTDRDLAIKALGGRHDPLELTIGDVMTSHLHAVHESTSIEHALGMMRNGPFRRLPVIDESGSLVGLICLDDILELLTDELSQVGGLIRREGPRALSDT